MNDSIQQPPGGALRILGIDPGLADVGWGLVEWLGSSSRSLGYGVIQTPAGRPLAERLATIHDRLAELIERERPRAVSIEQLFFARNVKTAMVVAHGRAACILATAHRRVEVFEYTPLQIKQALTGHGRAGKAQVQAMVRAVLGLREIPRPDHAADALAAALCHAHSLVLAQKIVRSRPDPFQAPTDPPEADPRKLLLEQRRTRRRRH